MPSGARIMQVPCIIGGIREWSSDCVKRMGVNARAVLCIHTCR